MSYILNIYLCVDCNKNENNKESLFLKIEKDGTEQLRLVIATYVIIDRTASQKGSQHILYLTLMSRALC
jgi:hypothetical protein